MHSNIFLRSTSGGTQTETLGPRRGPRRTPLENILELDNQIAKMTPLLEVVKEMAMIPGTLSITAMDTLFSGEFEWDVSLYNTFGI